MGTLSLTGSQGGFYAFKGNETVLAGSGNVGISITGNGSVVAGGGADGVVIYKSGTISVGSGADTLSLLGGGSISQTGGSSSITVGTGNYLISETGLATVAGSGATNSFASATIVGGELSVTHSGNFTIDTAVSGDMTIKGGSQAPTEFVGGPGGSQDFVGKSGSDTFLGGTGSDSMHAVGVNNVFEFGASGTHTVYNFVGTDQLYVNGLSYATLKADGDISYTLNAKGAVTATVIKEGTATITLKGFKLDDATKGVIIKTEIKH